MTRNHNVTVNPRSPRTRAIAGVAGLALATATLAGACSSKESASPRPESSASCSSYSFTKYVMSSEVQGLRNDGSSSFNTWAHNDVNGAVKALIKQRDSPAGVHYAVSTIVAEGGEISDGDALSELGDLEKNVSGIFDGIGSAVTKDAYGNEVVFQGSKLADGQNLLAGDADFAFNAYGACAGNK